MADPSTRTRREQVLDLLRQGGWIDGPDLANERVGGSEGLRRLRELRDDGYVIHERRHPDPARAIWQYRLETTRLSPFRSVAPFKQHVEVEDVPSPDIWFCWHCGAKTTSKRQPALGGFAEVICPEARRRVIGVPRRDLAKGDGTHNPRTKRSLIK